jgi:hypothetical protein
VSRDVGSLVVSLVGERRSSHNGTRNADAVRIHPTVILYESTCVDVRADTVQERVGDRNVERGMEGEVCEVRRSFVVCCLRRSDKLLHLMVAERSGCAATLPPAKSTIESTPGRLAQYAARSSDRIAGDADGGAEGGMLGCIKPRAKRGT